MSTWHSLVFKREVQVADNHHSVIPKSINIDRVEDLQDEEWQFVIDVNLHGSKLRVSKLGRWKSANIGSDVLHARRNPEHEQ